jgi:hypothetical protein
MYSRLHLAVLVQRLVDEAPAVVPGQPQPQPGAPGAAGSGSILTDVRTNSRC